MQWHFPFSTLSHFLTIWWIMQEIWTESNFTAFLQFRLHFKHKQNVARMSPNICDLLDRSVHVAALLFAVQKKLCGAVLLPEKTDSDHSNQEVLMALSTGMFNSNSDTICFVKGLLHTHLHVLPKLKREKKDPMISYTSDFGKHIIGDVN